jgi:hypothetical protein
MKKEIIGKNEINISHDLSGRLNVRKERLELHENIFKAAINLKTA